jgi:hypothetical protein
MKRSILLIAPLVVLIGFVLQSCSHYDDIMKNAQESTSTEKSHDAGRDCMSCHHDNSNEASEKWWYVAGTVFEDDKKVSEASGSIELWTKPSRSGELLNKLPVDQSGNFYTAKIFSFKGGFYPVYVGNNGKVKEMSTKTSNGSCNSCHGITEEEIEVD